MKGRKSRAKRVKHTHAAETPNNTPTGRLNSEICRLCHGRFSVKKLRLVFGSRPDSEVASQRFCWDFQQLLGLCVKLDSKLSPFICSDCHSQFYQCYSILHTFKHHVNSTHTHSTQRCSSTRTNKDEPDQSSPPLSADPRCLLRLVSWTHEHAASCTSPPGLQEVLEERCGGTVRVVWRCEDGHTYTMDTGKRERHPDSTCTHNHQPIRCRDESSAHTDAERKLSSAHSQLHTEESHGDEISSPAQPLQDSDVSYRNLSSEEEEEETKKISSEDSTHPTADTQVSAKTSKDVKNLQPKARKKPGPKPGWKKIRSEREELPTIYKCPHQGCTAVYRGVDGLKKHVKEHHEEVRERPCPHPGCNKVFMIDRYLQRHVKLIHTEVRNYICDQCGRTFKQRKHLSVHQMRHSGAKPLQCEVCGFQCRQRASLKYHMTKHKAEAELEFACSVCERRFEKAHNLNVHMSMVHPLLQEHHTHTMDTS